MAAFDASTKSKHDGQNRHDMASMKRKPTPKANGPQFTIPRLKKIKRDLLTDLPLDAHECQQEILAIVRKSFHFPYSNLSHEFTKVQSVHNPDLMGKYLERKRDMKSNGYSDAFLADTYAFIPVENPALVEKMCRDGVRCGNQNFSGLGVSHMAVHVCKHADILWPLKPKCGEKILLMVKVLKGKIKTVLCKNVGVQLEPTPNYDCHIAKPNVDQTSAPPPHMLFYSSQLYLYEYGDFEILDYPRQVLPYAVVYYKIKEPQPVIPKNISSSSHPALATSVPPQGGSSALPSLLSSAPPLRQDPGPNNEVWRGRLHVRLVKGGHIYIEVSMLSYFVPLTITLMSPIKIHGLYPEHNAQFTFFCGLTNIAQQDEVEWRAHYFRYCLMRPRANNEGHFKALVKHISTKREMPTVRLPNDVFLFMMPNCLLASQLGLVRREDDTPVLHCVIMSKYSTSQAQQKKLAEKNNIFQNYGSAASLEELFDDSDFSDEDEVVHASYEETSKDLKYVLPQAFRSQRGIQNRFSSMSLADADLHFAPCACKRLGFSKPHHQQRRDKDITKILAVMQSSVQPPSQKPNPCLFPSGSRYKPKAKFSQRTRAMPSFSPHGSSDSDSDDDSNIGRPSKNRDKSYSLLSSTKTVEEELSEEELTNEQMEDIIFLRKPALTAAGITKSKPSANSSSNSSLNREKKNSFVEKQTSKSSVSTTDFKKSLSEPSFSAKPKIIPTDPVELVVNKSSIKTKTVPPEPKIIPTEPIRSPKPTVTVEHKGADDVTSVPVNQNPKVKPINSAPKTVKPILKASTVSIVPSTSQSFTPQKKVEIPSLPAHHPSHSLEANDFGDVDMRVPHQHSSTMHPVFLSAVQPSSLQPPVPRPQQHHMMSNLASGAWLGPGDMKPPPRPPWLLTSSSASSSSLSDLPLLSGRLPRSPSPISLPAESPPSPADSPASPPVDSPASPPSPPGMAMDLESPASPPHSAYIDQFRSSPIAIPTSRLEQNASPEIGFIHQRVHNPQYPQQRNRRGSLREGIDSADDMKDFLNAGVGSDLDSSYEDER